MGRSHKSGYHHLRQHDRYPTCLDAEADFEGGTHPVKILDISDKGLLIEASHLPAWGTRIRLRGQGLKVSGLVVWKSDHLCGVFLSQPIKALSVIWNNLPRPSAASAHQLRH